MSIENEIYIHGRPETADGIFYVHPSEKSLPTEDIESQQVNSTDEAYILDNGTVEYDVRGEQ